MWVSRLRLENFRNHTLTECLFDQGVTLFVGSNGQGKTNLVEALIYLGTGQSHRTTSDEALVQTGHDHAELGATVHADNRSVRLALALRAKGSNKPSVNESPTTLAELSSWLNVVAFSPEDIAIIRQDPSHRRRFLDTAMVGHFPRFSGVLADYDRVVKQRNAVLKSFRQGRKDDDSHRTLDIWDEKLVSLATEITRARFDFLAALAPFFDSAYREMKPGHRVSLEMLFSHAPLASVYREDVNDAMTNAYWEVLRRVEGEEKERGLTLFGPHRDDLAIFLNDLPTRTHSSQGEAWSLALSLKIAVATIARQDSFSGDPIIVLDDVFSELDQDRRHALAEAVKNWEQVVITAAVETDIPPILTGRIRHIRDGALVDE